MTTPSVAKRHDVKVEKVDDIGVVFGWAIISTIDGEPYFDLQGDHIPDDAILKAAVDFVKSGAIGKTMHAGVASGKVLFVMPVSKDLHKGFGQECKTTGLQIGFMPDSAEDVQKFRDGTYTGFSIGGQRGEDEEVTDV